MSEIIKDGYKRVVHPDCVDWYIHRPPIERHREYIYCIARFPFVPDYHLCEFVDDPESYVTERPLQQFKTLAEALAILRVLDANTKGDS
jgi:hypothetical protein